MTESSSVVALITAPTEQAGTIARALVERRAAACVNVIDGVQSVYRWQGAVEEEPEALLVVKTLASSLPEVERLLRELHPYEVFELVALPIVAGSAAYLGWIGESVSPDAES